MNTLEHVRTPLQFLAVREGYYRNILGATLKEAGYVTDHIHQYHFRYLLGSFEEGDPVCTALDELNTLGCKSYPQTMCERPLQAMYNGRVKRFATNDF